MSREAVFHAVAEALGITLPASLFSSEQRLFHLEASGSVAATAEQLLVEAWAMDEGLDEAFQLTIDCLSVAPVDLGALLGQPLSLRIALADGGSATRSGIVCAAETTDSDAGLHRHRLTLVPWLWLLGQMRGSAVWQERPFTEVIDAVAGTAQPLAQWRWSAEVAGFLGQSHNAGQRSYIAQYRETPLAFLCRQLAHEGIAFRIEEDAEAPGLHSAVFFTDSASAEACPEDPTSAAHGGIRFHRASSQEESDAIQAIGKRVELQSATTTVLSWDYKGKRSVATSVAANPAQPLGPNAPRLEDYDAPGAYAYGDGSAAEHHARLRREALECRASLYIGRSTVRTFRPGTHFTLAQGPLEASLGADTQFVLTRVRSAGINNLPARMIEAIARRWASGAAGADLLPADLAPEVVAQAQASGFGNAFEALPQLTPWRPRALPKPRAPGVQSAIVVGPQGETSPGGANEIHCDRLGRVRVAFHWQRGKRPDDRNTCWLRVSQAYAGGGFGSHFLPRVGQEVLVGFVEGNIDRPMLRGSTYNGRGEGGIAATPGGQAAESDRSVFTRSSDHQPSGQGNLSGGHSPAWHGAAAEEQSNPAALSGFKTKEYGGSGYNALVFDDTNGQLRVQWGTTQHASWLNLGHLVHQADNHRGSFRGTGWELRTDAWGAVRAKQGLLISSYGTDPADPAGDNAPGQALAKQMVQLADTFSQAAGTHQTVQLASHIGSIEPNKSHLSDRLAPLKALQQAVDGMVSPAGFDEALGDAGNKNTSPAKKLPHTTDPVIGIAARAGLAAVAGQDILMTAGEGIHFAAGQDGTRAIGGAARLHTGQAIGVLAGAVQPGDEAAGTGLTMIAGHGDVVVQAQSATMQIAAKGLVNVQSASSHVDWAAAKKITLQTSGGASITIEGGGITTQCPGKITVKAATKSMTSASGDSYVMPVLPKAENSWVNFAGYYDDAWNTAWPLDQLKVNLNGKTIAKAMDVDMTQEIR